MSLPVGLPPNNPKGRPVGTKGKLHAQTIMGSLNNRTMERLRAAYERDDTLLTPLHIFFMVMNGQTMDGEPLLDLEGKPIQFDWKTRLAAADKASAFFHTKLPQPVEHSGPGGGPIQVSNSTARLEDLLFGSVISLDGDVVEAQLVSSESQNGTGDPSQAQLAAPEEHGLPDFLSSGHPVSSERTTGSQT